MSRVVHLHIGAPKTGTTYLQHRLSRNSRTLAKHDVYVPTRSPLVSPALFQFRAALDLLGQDWGGPPGHAEGAWPQLVRRVRSKSGTSIVSHEILAPAQPDVVARAMRDLEGCEVHIVYSARDLARALPAAWQESIKQGRRWSYRRFLNRVEFGRPWFFRAFDLPNVLGTWGAGVPAERVHLVTVPQRQSPGGADPGELFGRFCTAFGIDPAWAPLDSDRLNTSLGVAETQVIRQLNRRMDRATRREAEYDELIRELLAQDQLVHRRSAPVRLPPGRFAWASEQSEQWIEWVKGSGIHVVGDLEDLRPLPLPDDEEFISPDKVPPRIVLAAAVDALSAMTREAAARPDPRRTFGARFRKLRERS
jgi:hypothetical protein